MTGASRTALVEPDPAVAAALARACPAGTAVVAGLTDLERLGTNPSHEGTLVVVLGPAVDTPAALALSSRLQAQEPRTGVVLVRRRLDTPLLAAALRAGVREVVAEPETAELTGAVERAHRACARVLPSPAVDTGARITTVFAAKGGVGKTTVSVNLAAHLAAGGLRVALVDLDVAFGDVAVALGLFPPHSLADAAAAGEDLDSRALRAMLVEHSGGTSVLAAPADPGQAESVTPDTVSRALTLLRDDFDHIIVDTPPALDERVLAAVDHSDLLVLVATLDVPAIKNLRVALEALDLIGVDRTRQRILLNRADAEVGVLLSDVPAALGREIAAAIPSSRDVAAAVNAGRALVLSEPGHAVSRALAQFADEQVAGRSARQHGRAGAPQRRWTLPLRRVVTA